MTSLPIASDCTAEEMLLHDRGIPDDCPTCTMNNWAFTGNVTDGVWRVWCRTCGHAYEMMDQFEALAHHAMSLATAASRADLRGECGIRWDALVRAWHAVSQSNAGRRYPVCTTVGDYDPDDDDAKPF